MPRIVELVIIGGGEVGPSIAYHLAARGCDNVCVLERGEIGQGATARATGGIRQQFSSEINIRLSQESLKRFERFEEEMGSSVDFSGHGFMHAPAVGQVLAEVILDGEASTIDISALSLDRFRTGRLFPEREVF